MHPWDDERIDYLKWLRVQTVSGVVASKQELAGYLEMANAAIQYDARLQVVAVGRIDGAGYQPYMYDLAGPAANYMCMYLNGGDWQKLRRIDWRIEFAIDDDTFRNWRAEQAYAQDTRRNYNAYNTKTRRKNDMRDRGGYGIALGSLKSALRINFYREQTGRLALEISLKQKYAQDAGAGIRIAQQAEPIGIGRLASALQVTRDIARIHFHRVFGYSVEEFISKMQASEPFDLKQAHADIDRAEFENKIARLSKREKMALVQKLLFGLEDDA